MPKAIATTDHDGIRRWTEERGGTAACVKGTGGKGDPGMLRIDFPGFSGGDTLRPISWGTAARTPRQAPASLASTRRGSSAVTTVDHDEIRRWVEERGGHPASVKRTRGRGDPGLLRIDYPGYSGTRSLQRIGWDEFFEKFEESRLAFLYEPLGESRFSKLVRRSSRAPRSTSSRNAAPSRHGKAAVR